MKFDVTLKDINSDQLRKLLGIFDHSGVITSKFEDKGVVLTNPINIDYNESVEASEDVQQPELAKSSKGDLIPWDERIHSSGKSITKDGRWTMKRKVEPELVDSVESELSGGEPLSATVETLSTAIAENNISIFAVTDALDKLGLQSINDANGNPELIKQIKSELGL